MDMHGPNSEAGSQASSAAHRWYSDGARMDAAAAQNLIGPDDMDVFFHSMSDASGNPVNPASYYASPAAAAAARAAAVHGYHRPSPHGKRRCATHVYL